MVERHGAQHSERITEEILSFLAGRSGLLAEHLQEGRVEGREGDTGIGIIGLGGCGLNRVGVA